MAATPIIIYDRDGFPTELIGETDWRRAIARGRIVPSMPVTVVRAAGAGRMMSAGDVPELREIFEEFDPSPIAAGPAAVQPPPVSPAPPSPPPPDNQAASPPPPLWQRSWVEDRRTPLSSSGTQRLDIVSAPPDAPPPPAIPTAVKAVGAILAILLLLALLGQCDPSPSGRDEMPSDVEPLSNAAIGTALSGGAPFETSFDCRSASLPAETAICADRQLAAQDREVARLYAAAIAQRETGPRSSLQADQRAWLAQRNACGQAAYPESCLSRLYVDRISALRNLRDEPAPVETVEEPERPPRRQAETSKAAAPPPPAAVLCILPEGAEARISFGECRQRSGVVMPE